MPREKAGVYDEAWDVESRAAEQYQWSFRLDCCPMARAREGDSEGRKRSTTTNDHTIPKVGSARTYQTLETTWCVAWHFQVSTAAVCGRMGLPGPLLRRAEAVTRARGELGLDCRCIITSFLLGGRMRPRVTGHVRCSVLARIGRVVRER